MAYVGDGNNVCHSLMAHLRSARVGFVGRDPAGYEPTADSVDARTRGGSLRPAASLELRRDPGEAARGADVVYTDVWTSMGQEDETRAAARAISTATASTTGSWRWRATGRS